MPATKLAANSWCYKNLEKERAIEKIGGLGVQGIELIAHQPCFHANVEFTDEEIKGVTKLVAQNGMRIVALSPATDYLKFTDVEKRMQIDHTNAITDLCVKMGVNISRIFSGGAVPEGKSRQECVDAVVECLKECSAYAEEKGVKLAIESHGKFGCDLDALVTILESVDSPNLGVTLDTANFYHSGVDPVEATNRLQGRIFHTHLKDGKKTDDGWEGTAVGEGDVDFPAIFQSLKEQGYNNYYCIEFEGTGDPDIGLQKSVDYVKSHLGA